LRQLINCLFHSLPFNVAKSPGFHVAFALSAIASFTTGIGFGGCSSLVFGICQHVAAQFDILGLRLENLECENADKFNVKQNHEIREKLRAIVQQHEALIKLCTLLSETLRPIIVIHFVSSAADICASCLLLLLTEGTEFVNYLFYASVVVLNAFLFALAGSNIIHSSIGLQMRAYNFPWFKCDKENQKIILLIIRRSQKKVCLEVPFFQASLESFVTVNADFFLPNRVFFIEVLFEGHARSWLLFDMLEKLYVKLQYIVFSIQSTYSFNILV